ncbi:NAD-dependent epimerase/dehydratase family protein [Bacteroidia bacterium]|nr:NAD-dependent epimerase/dehydratase family protein [Bacteroidia bacterium]
MINKSDKIYIAGHRGMVGSACWRALEAEGYTNFIGKTSKDLDLRDQKAVELWGTGSPMREFLHVDDLAQAVLFGLENTLEEHLYNVGTGVDLTLLIQSTIGHKGEIVWDTNKPDGTPRKLMDNSKLEAQGWNAEIDLSEGVEVTYKWFLHSVE